MKTMKTLLAAALVAAVAPALAADLALMPASKHDQVPTRLVAAKRGPMPAERAPVAFSWALDPAAALAEPAPHVAESREYWTDVDQRALASGLSLRTGVRGAVVRLSPMLGAAAPVLRPADVSIRQRGRTMAAREAIADADVAEEFESRGMAMPERTIAFRLAEAVEPGAFALVVPNARGRYLVHVYEPGATDVLALTTDRTTVLEGGELTVVARFESAAGRTLGRVEGIATSPGGDTIDLAFKPQRDGTWQARFAPGSSTATGLWEVHAFAASSDGEVARDAKLAFGAASPTARVLRGTRAGSGTPGLDVEVDVASPGRYNVSAILYATDATGTLVPAAIAHAAAVLQPGRGALPLRFATDTLASAGLSAPYEVRDLVLTNQADLGVIEKRARAFAFE